MSERSVGLRHDAHCLEYGGPGRAEPSELAWDAEREQTALTHRVALALRGAAPPVASTRTLSERLGQAVCRSQRIEDRRGHRAACYRHRALHPSRPAVRTTDAAAAVRR